MDNNTNCFICETEFVSNGFSTGYGVDENGKKICFECCGRLDGERLANMEVGEKTVLYLTEDKENAQWYVVNWPSTLKIKALCSVKPRGHNWGLTRYDVWFTYRGKYYHGVKYGKNTDVLHVKRLKYHYLAMYR